VESKIKTKTYHKSVFNKILLLRIPFSKIQKLTSLFKVDLISLAVENIDQ
jgi:hypothetical protein